MDNRPNRSVTEALGRAPPSEDLGAQIVLGFLVSSDSFGAERVNDFDTPGFVI